MMIVRDHSLSFVSVLWALLVGATVAAGCYRPSIGDGSLGCGPNGACPDGFHCVTDRCYTYKVDASALDVDGSKPDVSGDGSRDTTSDASDGAEVCVARTAISGCSPRSDLTCDPVCQTTCCTSQKCSALYNNGGPSATTKLGCVDNVGTRALGDGCDVYEAGSSNRHDNCAPGLICVAGNVGNYCLKLCRGDDDCNGTACELRPLELAKEANSVSVCGLAPATCDPASTSTSSNAGCAANHVCYLVERPGSSDGQTVCEIRSGGTARNLSCTQSRDCLAGLTCPTVGAAAGICRPVCSRKNTPDGCPTGTTCQPSSTDFGFCF